MDSAFPSVAVALLGTVLGLAGCREPAPPAQVTQVLLPEPPPPPSPSPYADCPAELLPVHRVIPRMPRELHQEFAGEATIGFVIEPSGAVADARIESAQWEPVGHGGGDPRLFEASILAAVAQWRYPPQSAACFQRAPMRFVFPD